jgi:hypothetical protein
LRDASTFAGAQKLAASNQESKQVAQNTCRTCDKKSRGRPKGSGLKDKAVKQVAAVMLEGQKVTSA